jgi:bacillithiol synthase
VHRRSLYPIDRKALSAALHVQNAPYISRDSALAESLSLLERDTTYTITTGQQVGWLTGPLYTIYKAVSAIQLARQVEADLGPPYRVVPIFWMASEDHDAEEVRWMATHWERVWRYAGHFQGPVGRHRIEKAFPPG